MKLYETPTKDTSTTFEVGSARLSGRARAGLVYAEKGYNVMKPYVGLICHDSVAFEP
jgi:hypothetical protein